MNIVEGNERGSPADFSRFLTIALGSLAELRYQLELAASLDMGEPDESAALRQESAELRAMLAALRARVRRGVQS